MKNEGMLDEIREALANDRKRSMSSVVTAMGWAAINSLNGASIPRNLVQEN